MIGSGTVGGCRLARFDAAGRNKNEGDVAASTDNNAPRLAEKMTFCEETVR